MQVARPWADDLVQSQLFVKGTDLGKSLSRSVVKRESGGECRVT